MIRLRSFWKNRLVVVCASAVATALIAWLDSHVHHGVPLGLLYLLPMALISTTLGRWEVVVAAALCTFVAEYADAFSWNLSQGSARDALYFIAYAAEGMYISEMLSKGRIEKLHVATLTHEVAARREAEEQLSLLVGRSSVAIITTDECGAIVQANEAAERLFAPDEMRGSRLQGTLEALLPALARVPIRAHGARSLRTMMQCQGFRVTHEPFVADVWFSTYQTPRGTRMTAVIADVSDELRSREESNLEQILNGSRLVVGAMAHELRNVCAAIGLVGEGLRQRLPELAESEDFKALRQLTGTLERMTSVELSQVKRSATPIRLQGVLDDLRIIFTPALRDTAIDVAWSAVADLPVVWADQQGLLQVFLNLLRNAQKALEGMDAASIEIMTRCKPSTIEILVTDNGPGIASPEQLFRPFETRTQMSGFGLYLSRAIVSSFRGELRYEPTRTGARFVVELLIAR